MEGMYWCDFRSLIDRNKKPWRWIHYYRSDGGFKDTISIVDFSYPRRKGTTSTVEGHARDWFRDSLICNAGYLDGWIPLRRNSSVYNYQTHEWEVHPVRGIQDTLNLLLRCEVIERSREIEEVLAR